MMIQLHKEATTTPKTRAEIQTSKEPARLLAARYGVTEQTIRKWRNRDSVADRSHTPHRLQTTLTPGSDHTSVIYTFNSPRFVRKSAFDKFPLKIAHI